MDFSALEGHQDMLEPGTPDIARLRADAIPLLTQIDAREHLQTEKVIPLPAGMWNALYQLEPSGVIVKTSVMNNDFEVNFLRQAGVLDIPAPRVLGAGALEHPILKDATYFLMTYIPNSANAWGVIDGEHGIPMTPDAVRQLGFDLGGVLAKLHTVHLGYVTRWTERVDRLQQTLTDFFTPDWDNLTPNALFDDELLPIFRRILDETDFLSFSDGTLTHCDMNLSNVLVDVDTHRLSAVIDPGGYGGMPMFDLAYAAIPWDHGFDFHRAVLDGYRQSSDYFDPVMFYTSILVVAYRHDRFHTPAVRESIFRDILPHIVY
jgi:aminoglycoside phosphotransferase (APT) family kinase protein